MPRKVKGNSHTPESKNGKPSPPEEAPMTFSIPIKVISVFGIVTHMRPLPSLSTTTTLPVSAIAKFEPLTPMPTSRNFLRR